MQTKRLVVRRFRQSDLDELCNFLADEEVMRFIEPPYSAEKAASFLKRAGLCAEPLIFAVEDKWDRFVGYVIYHPYDGNSYEIGWVLRREEWHKGYAQELTEALIADAKEKTDYLVIECSPGQEATKKIARNNGFDYAGETEGCEVYRCRLR